uniref:HDIG domain-containing protein n=1 Tax=Ignisphaera aggregans TaxID=334771 RepID=A0A7J2U4P2_9CREN
MCIDVLWNVAKEIKKENYGRIVSNILSDPRLSFTEAKPLIDLCQAPAAPRKHHFFTGGLVLHTLSVALIAKRLAEILKEVYGININEDLVIAGALLHDIFKFYQYISDPVNGGYRARDDWYLSHDYAIVAELAKRGAPDELIRVVSEAHGLAPFSTLEGFVVHLADSIDARFGEFIQSMLVSKLKDIEKEGCASYKALDEFVKRRGLKTAVELMQQSSEKLVKEVKELCKQL